jgi:hypothetical protein
MSGAWRMVSMAGFMFEMLYVVLENDDVWDDVSMEALFTFLQILSWRNTSLAGACGEWAEVCGLEGVTSRRDVRFFRVLFSDFFRFTLLQAVSVGFVGRVRGRKRGRWMRSRLWMCWGSGGGVCGRSGSW